MPSLKTIFLNKEKAKIVKALARDGYYDIEGVGTVHYMDESMYTIELKTNFIAEIEREKKRK